MRTVSEKVFVLNGAEDFNALKSNAPDAKVSFDESYKNYFGQVSNLDVGKESVLTGDFNHIQDARAALVAVREVSQIPFLCYMEKCDDPLAALLTLQALGADAFGCADNSLATIRKLKEYAAIPLIVKVEADDDIAALVDAGANILIGDIESEQELEVKPPVDPEVSALTSACKTVFIGPGRDFAVIGERINPTGKIALQEELKKGCLDMVKEMALDQIAKGAVILDVNIGMPGIDEKETMANVVSMLAKAVEQPLCIDSASPEVVEAALRVYPGRALVNSISAESPRLENLLPVAAKYGAMIIALPMTDDGIPETVTGRWEALQKIADMAAAYGYEPKDICVDGLLLAVCTSPTSGKVSLETISLANQAGYPTVCGLSNISFGMPERPLLNSTFLAMAIGKGLTTAIGNPSSEAIMKTIAAAEALNGQDADTLRYIMKVTAG